MKRCVGWINHEWLVRYDLRGLPAAVDVVVVDLKHVICLDSTECVLVVWARLLFENLSLVDLQVLRLEGLFHRGKVEARSLHHSVGKHAATHGAVSAVDWVDLHG